jgi:hypothetical protein
VGQALVILLFVSNSGKKIDGDKKRRVIDALSRENHRKTPTGRNPARIPNP